MAETDDDMEAFRRWKRRHDLLSAIAIAALNKADKDQRTAVGEVARLQSVINDLEKAMSESEAHRYFLQWQKAAHEVERLREALRPFAGLTLSFRTIDEYRLRREWIEQARAALAASPGPKLVECDQCGGTGFDTPGTGYGNVCSKCGGQRELPAEPGAGGEWQTVRGLLLDIALFAKQRSLGIGDFHWIYMKANAALAAAPQGADNARTS